MHAHLSPDSLCLLRLEEVEQYIHQVRIVIVRVYDIAVCESMNESKYTIKKQTNIPSVLN